MHLIPHFPDVIEVSLAMPPASLWGLQTFGHQTQVHIPPVYVYITPQGSVKKPKQSNTGGHFQGSNFWHEANTENS